jgi:23S rRNA pseudouridine1911/1915/1917 synthase
MGLFPKERNLARPEERVEIEVRAKDFQIRAGELSIRLDAFLQHHLPWRSRTSIQELIHDGYVALARPAPERGGRIDEPQPVDRPGVRLREGARVVVTIPEELRLPALERADDELEILYEDEDLIAVDKPPFLPVHPSGRHLNDTLIQRLHARYYAQELEDERRRFAIRLCHRLDRETSGLVLCAKTRDAHRLMGTAFEERRVEKEYLAVVVGEPAEDEGLIDRPLGPSRTSEVGLKMTVAADGLPSRTRWRVLERHAAHALVACRPLTGRQHQIRVHLQAIGHPIVGDKLYGPDEGAFLRHLRGELGEEELERLGMRRQALHNHRLVFASPRSGERVEIVCPLASDMRSFLDGERKP